MIEYYTRWPGNYLAFFSSYAYLDSIRDAIAERHPEVPIWSQTRGMQESDRALFLERFTDDGTGIGFAVLGGAFGEGIDLVGRRLVGAFVATLGLPQSNPMNEAMCQRIDQVIGYGRGYDYVYRYPGLRRVVQAAGRVVRGCSDRGRVVLIDDRFNDERIQRLLPSWWIIRSDVRKRPCESVLKSTAFVEGSPCSVG